MLNLGPEFFDAMVIVNVVIGLAIAGRRFLHDIRGSLPKDAPAWAHERYNRDSSNSSFHSSSRSSSFSQGS